MNLQSYNFIYLTGLTTGQILHVTLIVSCIVRLAVLRFPAPVCYIGHITVALWLCSGKSVFRSCFPFSFPVLPLFLSVRQVPAWGSWLGCQDSQPWETVSTYSCRSWLPVMDSSWMSQAPNLNLATEVVNCYILTIYFYNSTITFPQRIKLKKGKFTYFQVHHVHPLHLRINKWQSSHFSICI